jgi:hypothetical protein
MIVIAIVCGPFRMLYDIASPNKETIPSIVMICAYLALLSPVVVAPWFTLANRRISLVAVDFQSFGIERTILVVGILNLAAYFLLIGINEVIEQLVFIQLGACISAVATTLVIRLCGFRMIREVGTIRNPGRV